MLINNDIEIITVDDYTTFQIGDNNAPNENSDIQSAINLAYKQLNGICSNEIYRRWIITDTSSPDYLTDDKKSLIQDAMLLQTKYNLDYDNNLAIGSIQQSIGNSNWGKTVANHKRIEPDVLRLLTKAGVYQQYTTAKINEARPFDNNVLTPNSPDPSDITPITYSKADERYIPKNATEQKPYIRQLIYDANGVFGTRRLEEQKTPTIQKIYRHTINISCTKTEGQQIHKINLYFEMFSTQQEAYTFDSLIALDNSMYLVQGQYYYTTDGGENWNYSLENCIGMIILSKEIGIYAYNNWKSTEIITINKDGWDTISVSDSIKVIN